MQDKHVLLGIGGGIAAYKTPDLVRKLLAKGYDVIPILTNAGSKFVTSHALTAVSGNRVRNDLWDEEAERAMGHIELGRWADVLLVAPATADLIARLANGLADDLLTTVRLATQAQVIVAPAMNQAMWLHETTQRNVGQLKADGVKLIGPEYGTQACGDVGPGRMSDPESIVSSIESMFNDSLCMHGLKVLVSAGPTREAIDPVRYISNSSSGRQGFAVAQAAQRAGAKVTIVSGPVDLATPSGIERVDVESALQMKDAVMSRVTDCDIFFSVAAVSDYRPLSTHSQKIKKSVQDETGLELALEQTDDILQLVGNLNERPFVVGFAAETHNVLEFGREKLQRKNIDAIVINDVSDKSIGFESLDNEVTILSKQGECTLPKQSKDDIAREIISTIAALRSSSKLVSPFVSQ